MPRLSRTQAAILSNDTYLDQMEERRLIRGLFPDAPAPRDDEEAMAQEFVSHLIGADRPVSIRSALV